MALIRQKRTANTEDMGETLTFDGVDKEFFGGGREEGGFLALTTSDPLKSSSANNIAILFQFLILVYIHLRFPSISNSLVTVTIVIACQE